MTASNGCLYSLKAWDVFREPIALTMSNLS